MSYKEYREEKTKEGLEYQNFIKDVLFDKLGWIITLYSSKAYQYNQGENKTGFEIKLCQTYKQYNTLWIEYQEKATIRNGSYVNSGILRDDNTWIYIIGDYDNIWIFDKNILVKLKERNKYQIKQTQTSIAFLLPLTDADKYCIKKIEIRKEC